MRSSSQNPLEDRKSPGEPQRDESPEERVPKCEVCGTAMFGLHCKLVCPNCGYKRDCSDP